MSRKLSRSSKSVAHHSPGRTRIKVPHGQRKHLRRVKDEIEKNPGVRVEVNHDTGSILVHHDHDLAIFEILHKAVETVGTDLLTSLVEGEAAVEVIGPVGLVAAAFGIIEGFGKAIFSGGAENRGLTGQASDLKTLVPTAFLLAAAVKAYQTRNFWQGITPMLLCYWAFDTYWKFNVANPSVFEPHNGSHKHLREHEPKN